MNDLKEHIHENGIDYVLCGDYYIPEIQIPRQDRPIGHYGRLWKAYLQEFKPVQYQGCTPWTNMGNETSKRTRSTPSARG